MVYGRYFALYFGVYGVDGLFEGLSFVFFVGDEVGGGFECGVGRGYNSVFVFFEVVLVLEVVEYELGVVLEGLYFIGELLEVIGELLEFLVGEL